MLVHGSSFGEADSSAEEWEPVFKKFAAFFHVYAFDKIGQGFTDNPRSDQDYVIGSTVTHLYDFIRALDLPSVHLVGHSRGGYTVCRLDLEHPEVVKSLVIVDSGTLMSMKSGVTGRFYEELEARVATLSDDREKYRHFIAANSFRTNHITDQWLDIIIKISNLPKMQEAASRMGGGIMPGSGSIASKNPNRLGARFLRDLEVRQKETHEWIRAYGLKVPTLLVWGYNDHSARFDPVGLGALKLIFPKTPKSQMHILNQAGHYCFREQPEDFVATVTSFIKSL